MYQSIMVPTDCSGFDREAIRVGLRLAARTGATLHLVRVRTMNGFVGASCSLEGVEFPVAGERDDALAELTALGTECRASADAEVVIAVEDGPVADALAGYSRRNAVELIVISSHGRGGFARFSLGSVTDSLIRHTTVPVLVVKPAASYLNPQVMAEFCRIVVPLDGSTLSEQILPAVSSLAKLADAEITLINVLSLHESSVPQRSFRPIAWAETNLAGMQAYLSRIADNLRRSGITATSEVIIGDRPADEIAAYAARERADLIAIATHGRGGVSRILRGSVADSVTRNSRTSVFALHPVLPAESVPAQLERSASW